MIAFLNSFLNNSIDKLKSSNQSNKVIINGKGAYVYGEF